MKDGFTKVTLEGTEEQIETTLQEFQKEGIDYQEIDKDVVT